MSKENEQRRKRRPVDKAELKEMLKKQKNKGDVDIKYLKVQKVEATPSGKTPTFGLIDELKCVPVTGELSIDVIRTAFSKFWEEPIDRVDILETKRGPSVLSMSQINTKKVLYVRFVEKDLLFTPFDKLVTTPLKELTYISNQSKQSSSSVNKQGPPADPSKAVKLTPASVMRLGGEVAPSKELIHAMAQEFEIRGKSEDVWLDPTYLKIVVDKTPFATGGFRHAYNGKVVGGSLLRGSRVVLKKYKQDFRAKLKENEVDEKRHMLIQLQMHMIVRNYAKCLQEEAPAEFGECFTFDKVYFFEWEGEPASIEPFIEGEFSKIMNNTGIPTEHFAEEDSYRRKGEAFSHYTFSKSDDKYIVLDLQGIGYRLCDPEIATNDSKAIFTLGNRGVDAVATFLEQHTCNNFCKMLNLDQ